MKAAVFTRYGSPDVLQIKDVEKPIPDGDQVLIRVRAASVNPLDLHLMRGVPFIARKMLGIRKPTIEEPGLAGRDVAGQVEAVGRNVTRFKPGDEVFGGCPGAFAEYVCASETKLSIKPKNVTFEQAASVPVAALTALQGLRDKGRIQPGQQVLINGAAGGVGVFTVQMAKSFGAQVTGVCSSANLDFVRNLGADNVVDYTKEDFTRSPQRYDLIFDLVANHSPMECRRVLKPTGIYLGAGVLGLGESKTRLLAHLLATFVVGRLVSQQFMSFTARINQEDLAAIGELIDQGRVTPCIDRSYRLSEAADAMRYVEKGHARGKVVIVPGI